jgi:hypothetical protein
VPGASSIMAIAMCKVMQAVVSVIGCRRLVEIGDVSEMVVCGENVGIEGRFTKVLDLR